MGTQWRVSEPGPFKLNAGNSSFREILSVLAERDGAKRSVRWGQVLGLAMTVVVSAGGWALIIGLLLR